MKGRVTIAGAGPGEIDHLTIAVLRAIHAADVILYDALIGDSVIAEFPEGAETIFVGKRCGNHAYTQTMIIAQMIESAMAGKKVLRLKGGDPAIFAHLSSELSALRALGIEIKILPGVTAMLTAAAELGVPLTARGSDRNIWITDGHSADLAEHAAQMARFSGTLVFYMGSGRSAEIAQLLLAHGLPEGKSCVLVENAGSAESVTSRGTAAQMQQGLMGRKTTGPGILLIGDTVALPAKTEDAAAVQL